MRAGGVAVLCTGQNFQPAPTVGTRWTYRLRASLQRSAVFRLDDPVIDPSDITGMGLMIYDKDDGGFNLRLAQVSAYSSDGTTTH